MNCGLRIDDFSLCCAVKRIDDDGVMLEQSPVSKVGCVAKDFETGMTRPHGGRIHSQSEM